MIHGFKRKFILILLILLASLFTVAVAYAQGTGPAFPTDDDVLSIAKKLYCPVCPNTPLDVCETQACQDWRAQIRDQLTASWTEDQIINYFVDQYGERVLAEPQRSGFTSLVWLLPVIAVLLGSWIAYEILKSWRSKEPAVTPSPVRPQVAPEVLARIEKELQEMD
jgi:cytochrome c-type biogenesis protein CcmH